MLYVERNEKGVIIAIRQTPSENATEKKSIMDEELVKFLKVVDTEPWIQMLTLSDMGIIRIVEDLIDLLIQKKVFISTELPLEAQQKLKDRQRVRQQLSNQDYIVDNII